ELANVGEPHELAVERDRTDVVKIGAGDNGAVDLRLHHRALHRIPASSRRTLSMRRVVPTLAATATSTLPSIEVSGAIELGARTSTYSSATPGSVLTMLRTSESIACGSRSPLRIASAACVSARLSTSACARCSVVRYAFRLDSARPSGSRTIGQPTTSTGRL